jgi:hypothetical protein
MNVGLIKIQILFLQSLKLELLITKLEMDLTMKKFGVRMRHFEDITIVVIKDVKLAL